MSEVSSEKPSPTIRRVLREAAAVGALLIVLTVSFLIHRNHVRTYSLEDICRANLRSLALLMPIYADEYGMYPAGDSWCDAIAAHEEGPEMLHCPRSSASQGQSTYAMNSNAPGQKPDDLLKDMVLLFESGSGWNQAGGAELLTTECHEGCDAAFVDRSVRFVMPDEIAGLKWTDEDVADPNVPREA